MEQVTVHLQGKNGNAFPRGTAVAEERYSVAMADALRPYSLLRSGAKLLARKADTTERAARNWLAAICGPQSSALIRLMARDPAVAAAVQALVEEQRRLDQVREGRSRAARPMEAPP